jgi:L-amino acid N-acyltransferase YncA
MPATIARMTANVEIRPATTGDLGGVGAIYDDAVATSIATFDLEPPAPAYWHDRLDDMLVAVTGGSVVGYAYGGTYRPRAAYRRTRETSVHLAEAARGQGLGRRLYDELLTRLARDGAHTVLAVVALPNPASVALHVACGFEQVGLLREVGHKLGRYVDTAIYQRML